MTDEETNDITLTPAMQHFILHWGEMGEKWGVNRSVAQIHALLHLLPQPLTAEQISAVLSIARSNTSNSLKELQSWGLVRAIRQLGDRKDYFTSVRDVYELVDTVVAQRRQREFVPTLDAVKESLMDSEHDGTPEAVRARIRETVDTMQAFDDWYVEVKRLPMSARKSLLRLGGKIAAFIPKLRG